MELKKKKAKIWQYSPFHSFNIIEEDLVISNNMASQQYQTGTYVIINNDPAMQFSVDPATMMKAEKKLKADMISGKITDLVLSSPIRVTLDENGFYIQLEDEKLKEKVD